MEPAATSLRDGALGGALAAGAGALLTLAIASRWPPSLLANVLGPAPLPAALAAGAWVLGVVAGALAGRRAVRLRGNTLRRAALSILALFVAYLASVVASAAAIIVADRGVATLMVPFSLLGIGLSVCIVLLPYVAVPLGASALVLEGWTRSPPGGVGLRARRRARCVAAAMASAAVALLAAAWL